MLLSIQMKLPKLHIIRVLTKKYGLYLILIP